MSSKIMPFIIGRKIEMTQQFKNDGTVVPVTLIKAEPNIVTQLRTEEIDGYSAVQLGIEAGKLNMPASGHTNGLSPVRTLREFRVSKTDLNRGDQVSVESFLPGTKVDIVGISKGRGFTGVMKRHGFHGKKATHGTKDQARMPGSLSTHRQGKVIPGHRMGGHSGDQRVTVKNLEIVSVDTASNVIAIKGAVPGARGGLILVQTRNATTTIWQA